jgi:hypothetical protein
VIISIPLLYSSALTFHYINAIQAIAPDLKTRKGGSEKNQPVFLPKPSADCGSHIPSPHQALKTMPMRQRALILPRVSQ